MGRYPFGVELFHLLLHAGLSRRFLKSPLSRYNKKDPYRPDRSTPITALTITVDDPETPLAATRRAQYLTGAPGP